MVATVIQALDLAHCNSDVVACLLELVGCSFECSPLLWLFMQDLVLQSWIPCAGASREP